MNKRSKRGRHCSLCDSVIAVDEQRHVMSGKFKYYSNYAVNIGKPTTIRVVVYCPDCTTSHARWMKGRINDERETVDAGPGDQA